MTATNPKRQQAFGRYVHENQPKDFIEVIEQDSHPIPEYIRSLATKEVGPYEEVIGPTEIPTRWYTDSSLFEAEIENIWKKKWQMACRVEHLLEVGDTFVYNVAGLSIVIVRASNDEIKAYWNSCLHRGNPLRSKSGNCGGKLQCSFHGFTWNLQGESSMIPYKEQFPKIDQENFSLPEVQVAEWNGFVFVNPDLEAEPLEKFLGPIAEVNQVWPYKVEIAFHAAKVFNGNWKALQEAFMESFHVLTTHPQCIPFGGAEHCGAYAATGYVSLGVLPIALSNEYLPKTPDHQQVVSKMFEVWDDEEIPEQFVVPEGMTARQFVAMLQRNLMRPVVGPVVDETSMTEMMDVYNWAVYPNFHPFGIYTQPLAYSFRPHTKDPYKAVMEVMLIKPAEPGAETKPPPERVLVGEDEEFSSIDELGYFGAFISQDSSNMNNNIVGLENSQTGMLNLAHEFESKIRHFYSIYESEMGLSAADEVAALKQESKY